MEGGEMQSTVGLRKGAWTEEEDRLLRKCIASFGEGRWHQVPLRAGLNRCRKSCRLRWLNYLKPNIKRGEFSEDEVDLITRLHKLLGNRWSLIAGRLPGRTANDVKNYWNTHQKKKTASFQCNPSYTNNNKSEQFKKNNNNNNNNNNDAKLQITKNNIIKPRPRTFSSKSFFWAGKKITTKPQNPAFITNKPRNVDDDVSKKRSYHQMRGSGGESTWADQLERFLNDGGVVNDDDGSPAAGINGGHEADVINRTGKLIWSDNDEEKNNNMGDIGTTTMFDGQDDHNQSCWSDIDIWDLLGDHRGI